ncbi:MAG: DUF59 domain-containing protein [Planctomycetota bacterium]
MNHEDKNPDESQPVPQSDPTVERLAELRNEGSKQPEKPMAEKGVSRMTDTWGTPAASEPAPPPTTKTDEEPFLCEDAGTENSERIKKLVVNVLKTVFDPEIPVNIYALGMIYKVDVDEDNRSLVTMTLTSPSCPVAGTLPGEVEQKVKDAPGIEDAKVIIVWDPPWTPDMMSEAAKLELNMM